MELPNRVLMQVLKQVMVLVEVRIILCLELITNMAMIAMKNTVPGRETMINQMQLSVLNIQEILTVKMLIIIEQHQETRVIMKEPSN